MSLKALTVSQVNNYLKRLVAGDMILSNLVIEGEISNFKHHHSGHMYFSLKDGDSRLSCVMFKYDNRSISFEPENGMTVLVRGYLSVYEKDGAYQLYAKSMDQLGLGDLHLEFERLKKKLLEEGLFDPSYKKPLPDFPKKIGVVTSATGAAIRDIISVIKRRYPICHIVIYSSLVQGNSAPESLIKGLEYLDQREDIDLIIFGRGGGSLEELFAFNNEDLARTIFNLKKPSISAVGHETDFSISDFVADIRAATPSVAAELATPDLDLLRSGLEDGRLKLKRSMELKLAEERNRLDRIKNSTLANSPMGLLRERKLQLEGTMSKIRLELMSQLSEARARLWDLDKNLAKLDPRQGNLDKLSLVMDENGNLIRSIKGLKEDDLLNIDLEDGSLRVKILEVKGV